MDLQSTWQVKPNSANEMGFGEMVFSANQSLSTISPIIMVGEGPDSFRMTTDRLELFDRFKTRTVLTFGFVGSENVYQADVVKLAFQVRYFLCIPFIWHVN